MEALSELGLSARGTSKKGAGRGDLGVRQSRPSLAQ
jgi:hypothetical protein